MSEKTERAHRAWAFWLAILLHLAFFGWIALKDETPRPFKPAEKQPSALQKGA
ncbi:MAG: hypothetical protein ACK4NS_01310 [Saprospiraceae bacterium]